MISLPPAESLSTIRSHTVPYLQLPVGSYRLATSRALPTIQHRWRADHQGRRTHDGAAVYAASVDATIVDSGDRDVIALALADPSQRSTKRE